MDDDCIVQKCSVYCVYLGFIVLFKPCFAKAGKYLQEIKNKENSPSMWLLNKQYKSIYQIRNIQAGFNNSGFTSFCEIPVSDT